MKPSKFQFATLVALALASPLVAQTTLNVRDADIRAFIGDAAKVTGRTFIIDIRVQGKVTVVTDRALSRSEYFEIFLATLRANGLVAVPTSNGAFRIQPIDGASAQPNRVGGSATANRNAYVTEIIRLRAIDSTSALDTIRPLVSPQGSVSANRAGNSIVIVDFADNVRRIREVLARIDTDSASTRIVALKNAGAREIATALTDGVEELPASQYERNAWDPMTDEEVEEEATAKAAVEMRKPAEQSLADALKDDMEVRPHPNPNPNPHTDPNPSPSPPPPPTPAPTRAPSPTRSPNP